MRIMALVPPSRFSRNVARDLVYGCWCKGKRIAGTRFPPLPLVTIATILKKEKFEVNLIDVSATAMTQIELERETKKSNIIIILTSSVSFREDAQLLLMLKKINPNLKTVAFGGYVTAVPECALKHSGIDIVVRHEAEFIIRDLIKAFDKGDGLWKSVRGISFIEKGKCINNPEYPRIEDLDELPIPDRLILPKKADYFNPLVKRLPYTTMFTSRGCPAKCIFCASPSFYGNKIRFKSADKVLEELEIIQRLGYKEVFFRDEVFTFSKERVIEICQRIIKEGMDLSWICSTRVDYIDFETLRIMKEAGCHMLRLGVETGVQELLYNINKGITVGQTRQVFEWLHKLDLDTHAHIMIGIPGETKDTFSTTMRFVREIDPTVATFGILTPYPGTPLFNQLKKMFPEIGDETEIKLDSLHTESFYNKFFTELSLKDLSSYVRKSYRIFYLRPSYVLKWLKKIKNINRLKRLALAGIQIYEFIAGRN